MVLLHVRSGWFGNRISRDRASRPYPIPKLDPLDRESRVERDVEPEIECFAAVLVSFDILFEFMISLKLFVYPV